ncbi:hypothetical protein EC991_001630 [Linnemannia zychae]|nr:hypothetical protein EC991_001630 [Linnemannia zychae]
MNNLTKQLSNSHIHDNATITTTVAPGRTPKDLIEADNLIRTLHSYAESKIKSAKRGRNLVYANHYEFDLLQERPPIKLPSIHATPAADIEGAATTTTTKTDTTTEEKDKSHILEVTSWKMNEFEYSSGALPTLSRGLFTYLDTTGPPKTPVPSTTTTSSSSSKNRHRNKGAVAPKVEEPVPALTGKDAIGKYRILLRGYDKFFNVGEVLKTSTEWISENTEGPYEVTLKENGCIIFMSGLPPHLVGPEGGCIVTSKHSLGHADPETGKAVEVTHAGKGREWLEKGLAARGKTVQEFGRWLWDNNLTAVAELCDDSFEEHILEYPIEKSGLYVHGLNRNTVDFQTLPSSKVQEFAREWGLRVTEYVTLNTHKDVMDFADKVRNAGEYDNRAVEGFVVRSKVKGDGTTHFFKIKYDEPYLMYREWREITKRLWSIEVKEATEVSKAEAKRAAQIERSASREFNTPKKVESEPKKEVTPVEELKIRMRYPLTKHYVEFVRNLIKTQPGLFAGYNKNQGIIAIRDMFLKHWESKSSQEQDKLITGAVSGSSSGSMTKDDFQRTVIIPIATIGCGKTTVSVALTKLFGWGHVSSDDFHHHRKTSGQHFIKAVVRSLKDHTVVIADRNNHEFSHRQRIMETVKAEYPKTRFVALYWSHEETPINTVREIEIERVKNRGSNHQNMTPEFCPDYEFIIQRFLRTFEPLNPMVAPDSGFSYVIESKPGEESLVIVERIIKEFAIPTLGAGGIGNHAIPKPEEVKEAIRFSLEDWKPIRVVNGEAAKFHKEQQNKEAAKAMAKSSSSVVETATPTGVQNDSSSAVAPAAITAAPVVVSIAKAKKIKEPNYFAIAVDSGAVLRFLTEQFESRGLSSSQSGQAITTTTTTTDKAAWTQLYELFKTWQETNRIGIRQHVTLVHTTARKDTSLKRAQRANEIWKIYSDELGLAVKTPGSTVPNSPVTTPPALPAVDDGFTQVSKGARNQRQQHHKTPSPTVSPTVPSATSATSGTAPLPASLTPANTATAVPSPPILQTPDSPLSLESLSISDADLDATITVDYIVWTERIMILRVNKVTRTKSGKLFEHTQPVLHITVGTAGDLVKPFESNEVLRRWSANLRSPAAKVSAEGGGGVKEGPEIFSIKLETPVVLTGFLKAMWF